MNISRTYKSFAAASKDLIKMQKEMDKKAGDIIDSTDYELPGLTLPKIKATLKASNADPLLAELETQHNKGVQAVKEAIENDLDDMMGASWGWTSGARDIVDTGALRDSKNVTVSGENILISYGEPYAQLIHSGGYIQPYGNKNAAAVYIPGRPWVGAVLGVDNGPLEPTDWQQVYQDAFR